MPRFSLLSYNIYGLPLLMNPRRLRAIARELNSAAADVVALQEVQTHGYRHTLLAALDAYPHHAFQPFAYAPMGGLLTLARSPIGDSAFHLYRTRGPWFSTERPLHKGVLVSTLRHEDRLIVVLNTHIYANFAASWRPENPVVQVQLGQIRELVEVVRRQPDEALVIVCGDFNLPRGSFLYDELIARAGLIDPLAGDTRPTWRAPLAWLKRFEQPFDFILLRDPGLPGLEASVELRLQEPVPWLGGGAGRLSDHIALALDMRWR